MPTLKESYDGRKGPLDEVVLLVCDTAKECCSALQWAPCCTVSMADGNGRIIEEVLAGFLWRHQMECSCRFRLRTVFMHEIPHDDPANNYTYFPSWTLPLKEGETDPKICGKTVTGNPAYGDDPDFLPTCLFPTDHDGECR